MRRPLFTACLFWFLIGCPTNPILGAAQNEAQQLRTAPARSKMPPELPMQTVLFEAEQTAAQLRLPIAELAEELGNRGIRIRSDGKVHVEIIGSQGMGALRADVIAPFGGEISNTWRHRVEAWVPVGQLTAVGAILPPGYFMQRVPPLCYDPVEGEGPAVTNSEEYRDSGRDGVGVTIAVIDGGYVNLTAARTNGDAPQAGMYSEINYTNRNFEHLDDGTHGTGCVEAAYDHAPGARWRLYKIDSLTDLGTAVDDAVANGVDVITHSISWYNQGWADDSGDPCAAANTAANAGILFFTSAGNRAEQHWQGDYNGGLGSTDWHDWSATGDETVNILVPAGVRGTYFLSWEDGGVDLDLYLFDDADKTTTLASSTNSGSTFEAFTWRNNSASDDTVHLAVQRISGATTEFEVFLIGSSSWTEYNVPDGSTTSPSNSTQPLVLSCGAVAWDDFDSAPGAGPIQSYSSRGPSNSGNTLPDLCGPTNTQGFTYPGGFGGTSCATPNSAGTAAVLWSCDPSDNPALICDRLFAWAGLHKDWGDPDVDNTYGNGGINILHQSVYNYNDAFPEHDTMNCDATALMDISYNTGGSALLRLGDTMAVEFDAPDSYAELCFRVRPGLCTNLGDAWWGRMGLSPTACELTDLVCVRMDTAFASGDGDTASAYEFQVVFEGYWASMIHEDDPRYSFEGEEILPDSVFTPGTKIYYYIRFSPMPGPGPYYYQPIWTDQLDTDTWYEAEVLPDLCKDNPACLLYVDYFNRGAQGPIEEALVMLGRVWDRFDLGAEDDHQANGIGNRVLGLGKHRMRGPIGPSLAHLAQYTVMLINNGDLPARSNFSDGGGPLMPDDPSDDITFLNSWINETGNRGLWLSGDNIAEDFSTRATTFLNQTLGARLVHPNYRDAVGHSLTESCRDLMTHYGKPTECNSYASFDSVSLAYSGIGHSYDVVDTSLGAGRFCDALLYDRTDQTHPPGYHASADHVYPVTPMEADTVRTKIDGFSVHMLRELPVGCVGTLAICYWIRDVLGGEDTVAHPGYFSDASTGQYCPPVYPEAITEVPKGVQEHAYSLSQNYPNPFRGSAGTKIRYSVAKPGVIEVRIFDVAGRLVLRKVERVARPGQRTVIWDGRDGRGRMVASGVYFYQIKTEGFQGHKKMLLVR